MRIPVFIFILSLMFVSCTIQQKDRSEGEEIAVSILPQKYFIDRITDSTISTLIMIPASKSPATYEPLPSQIEALSTVKAYFRIGYIGFELAWMDKLSDANPEMKIFNLSEGIELFEGQTNHKGEDHHHHGIDPHIWMSPENCLIMSSNILNALVELYPDKKENFLKNYAGLKMEIEAVNTKIDSMLKHFDQRYFFIFHPALTYYAHDYQLIQTPIEIEGNEPSLRYMANVMQLIKAKGINDIFIQQQFDRRNAETITRETGGSVIEINPLDYNWPEQIISITQKMQDILKQQNAR